MATGAGTSVWSGAVAHADQIPAVLVGFVIPYLDPEACLAPIFLVLDQPGDFSAAHDEHLRRRLAHFAADDEEVRSRRTGGYAYCIALAERFHLHRVHPLPAGVVHDDVHTLGVTRCG